MRERKSNMEKSEVTEETEKLEKGSKVTSPDAKMGDGKALNMKFLSLFCLTFQNALLGLSMRYSRVRSGPLFFEGTAVLMAEIAKCLICCYLVYREGGGSLGHLASELHLHVVANKWDTLKVCVPAFVYLIQNNCLYVAAEHLDVATYQITYQLKILTTAVFSVTLLNRTLRRTQWLSLLVLVVGVAMVQLSDAEETGAAKPSQNRLFGFAVALLACCLSGFAGVYFEKILKGSAQVSVWMRNIQLSVLAMPLGAVVCYFKHGREIGDRGFFYGYDLFVVYLVMLNACGGLLVAVVVKYADNILKGFACSLAILVTCIASVFLFGFRLSLQFCLGATFVISAVFLYGYVPRSPPPLPTSSKA